MWRSITNYMTLPAELTWLLPVVAAPFVGSFVGLVAHRLPRAEPIVLGRSSCPSCHTKLTARDLVPLLSWLVARGRCRHCGVSISAFYPAIEVATLGVVLWAWTEFPDWQVWTTSIMGWNLMTIVLINRAHHNLPGAMILIWPLALLGLVSKTWPDYCLSKRNNGAGSSIDERNGLISKPPRRV